VTLPIVTAWPVPALPWQFEVGGLVMGGIGTTPYVLRKLDGLDLPAVRNSDVARPRAHGSFGGADRLAERHLVFELGVAPGGGDVMPTLLNALVAAWQTSDVDVGLTLLYPNWGSLLFMGRPRRLSFPLKPEGAIGKYVEPVLAEFVALDARVYNAVLQFQTILPPSAGTLAGLAFATAAYAGAVFETGSTHGAGFGASGGSTGAGGVLMATNAGNAPTPPVTSIFGPTNGASIILGPTGEAMTIGLNLAAGQWLEIDHDTHSCLLNGVANYQFTLDSPPEGWLLPPGTSDVHYLGDPGSYCEFRFRDAWW